MLEPNVEMTTDQSKSNLSFAWNGKIIATQLSTYHKGHAQESRYTLAWEIILQMWMPCEESRSTKMLEEQCS